MSCEGATARCGSEVIDDAAMMVFFTTGVRRTAALLARLLILIKALPAAPVLR